MHGRTTPRSAAITVFVAISFIWTLALAVSPGWHEQIHSDANRVEHSCAVTLVASGNYDQAAPPPSFSCPAPALPFTIVSALIPQWVQSPFLGARIFEHAPPAVS